MIKAGAHSARALDYDWGKSTNKGTIFVAVRCEVTRGDDTGKRITWYGYFPQSSKKVEERTMESLRFMGWRGNDLMNLGELDQEFEIVVEHEEYEGRVRAKVQWVNRAGGVRIDDPMGDDELRKFAASKRQAASRIAEVSGAAPPPSSGQGGSASSTAAPDAWGDEPPPPDDYDQRGAHDDIPF